MEVGELSFTIRMGVVFVLSAACLVSSVTAIPIEIGADGKLRLKPSPEMVSIARNAVGGDASSAADLGFTSSGLTILAQVAVSAFPGSSTQANDLWGYVSPSGREYAILGMNRSTGFVEVTNPSLPVIIGAFSGGNGTTSDIKVYQHYAYNVADSGSGMQIFDLDQIDNGVITLLGTVSGDLSGSHNLFINTDSGFAYPCASNLTFGFAVFDLADPTDPQQVGLWTENLAHDLFALSYDECPYAGRSGPCEIAFVFAGGGGLYSVDVTDKANMVTLSHRTYPNLTYCHQGWASDDRQLLFINDEIDEVNVGVPTTTYIFDISDVSNPQLVTTFSNGNPATDHNLMLRGNLVFEANYRSGLRVFDVTDIFDVQQVAFLDTHPASDAAGWGSGAWSTYPLLPSANILVSDMEEGLFVVKMGEPECSVATAPLAEDPVVAQNRFLSVTPTSPGLRTALRVIPSSLPGNFAAFEGLELWVGDPFEVSELSAESGAMAPTFTAAPLTCEPSFRDWGSLGRIQVVGEPVVPGAVFIVQAISEGCFGAGEFIYSTALSVSTTRYGDVTEYCGPGVCDPPDGAVGISDVLSLIAKFSNVSNAVRKARADMIPSCVDFLIDIADVLDGLRAFSGLPYQFTPTIPNDPCASMASCGFLSR